MSPLLVGQQEYEVSVLREGVVPLRAHVSGLCWPERACVLQALGKGEEMPEAAVEHLPVALEFVDRAGAPRNLALVDAGTSVAAVAVGVAIAIPDRIAVLLALEELNHTIQHLFCRRALRLAHHSNRIEPYAAIVVNFHVATTTTTTRAAAAAAAAAAVAVVASTASTASTAVAAASTASAALPAAATAIAACVSACVVAGNVAHARGVGPLRRLLHGIVVDHAPPPV
eukprot:7391987-Prymnesium_polylepis.1